MTHPDADLFATLLARRSTRAFDRQATVSAEELATVLRFTFGAHGHVQAHPEVDAVGKTSPSAGGLHPIEAYPLVMRVDGVPVGLYHYDAGRHALELLEPLDVHAAEELAVVFGAGQPWMSEPAFVCVLTARFGRTFWKYRRHERAFTVVLMDAAHMGQTFQLLCTALGLGTLFTAAINAADIDERLGIDGIKEGALAALLCGHAAPGRTPLEPAFEPFEPRRPPPPT